MTLRFERIDAVDWCELDSFDDRTIFQTRPWLDFVAEAQRAEPLVARIMHKSDTVGYFTGLVVRKMGLKILGSPFPGWTTLHMGFNLCPGVARREAMEALQDFAFRELRCAHVEIMDRRMTLEESLGLGLEHHILSGFEIDLTQGEAALFAGLEGPCRRAIRKAAKCGVVTEEATDDAFADDYYSQLQEVFARQSLVPTYAIDRVRLLMKHLLPTGRLLLLRARDPEGNCIATGIYPAMNHAMYFWGGASWRKDQILRPNEAVHWYAMRYWQARGIKKCDMGGGGEYKSKYGGQRINIPWFRKSRYPVLASLRNFASRLQSYRQQVIGRLKTETVGRSEHG